MSAFDEIRWLGEGVDYQEALALQEELVLQRFRGEIGDTLLLLEHAPVYTIGRTRDQSSLRNPELLPAPVVEINRGGQATYHGPGQLTGYLICDLKQRNRDLHRYLRDIEEALSETCGHYGVKAGSREGLTGVWCGERKLASIGVGVRKWIAMHGFGINIAERAQLPFHAITPCGLDGVSMTSLHAEAANDAVTSEQFGREFAKRFPKASSE